MGSGVGSDVGRGRGGSGDGISAHLEVAVDHAENVEVLEAEDDLREEEARVRLVQRVALGDVREELWG